MIAFLKKIFVALSGMLVFTSVPVMAAQDAEIITEGETTPEDIIIEESDTETVAASEDGATDENMGIRYIHDGRPLPLP